MRPAPFQYLRPNSLADLLVAVHAGATLLAGGQTLIPALRLRDICPEIVVDLDRVLELSAAITVGEKALVVGARVTHRVLAEHPVLAREYPWLRAAALAVGDVQVRNRGTVVGNLCWADPRANLAVALLASAATVCAIPAAASAERVRLPVDEFFAGFRRHALAGCVVTHLELPRRTGATGCYREFSRQPQDLAIVNLCAVRDGERSRVALGGIHQTPLRLTAAERLLALDSWSGAQLDQVLAQAFDGLALMPPDDPGGGREYRLQLARVELRRAFAHLAGLSADD